MVRRLRVETTPTVEDLATVDLAIWALTAAKDRLREVGMPLAYKRVEEALRLVRTARGRGREALIPSARDEERHCDKPAPPVQTGPQWRVWVHVKHKPYARAIGHVAGAVDAVEAAEIVLKHWTREDWDSEAFAYQNRRGRWRYYRLRATDILVLERVEKYDC